MYRETVYFLLAIPMRYFFSGSFLFFVLNLSFTVMSGIAALWSPIGKGLTSLALLCVMFSCVLSLYRKTDIIPCNSIYRSVSLFYKTFVYCFN